MLTTAPTTAEGYEFPDLPLELIETAPEPLDLTAFVSGAVKVVRVDTTAARHGDDVETIVLDIGGTLRSITAPDLLVLADEVRSFFATLDVDILEARQAAVEAEQHACACELLLDPDEEFCGSSACAAYLQSERRHQAVI